MLDIKVTHSTNIIRRGDSFSIYVDITNAYSTEVDVKSVRITSPIGFSELENTPNKKGFLSRVKNFEIGQTGILGVPSFSVEFLPHVTKEDNTPAKPIVKLQPTGHHRYDFFLRAGNIFGFKPRPDTYIISGTVDYVVNGKPCQEKIDIKISIFPSLMGMLVGTLIGSFLGTLVSKQFSLDPSIIPKVFANLTLGFIAAITLMRKKDVQPFVTIEDLWGGILLGFLVGYLGEQGFSQISGLVSNNVPSPKP